MTTRTRIQSVRFLGLAALLMSTAATAVLPARAAEDIPVGFAVAKSGWMEAYDRGATQAALMAIEDINAGGGLLGRKLVAIEADTKTDRARAAQVAQELLGKGAALLIVSCDYDMGSPAALAAEAAGKISIFTCAADIKAGVQGIGPRSFSASAVATAEGATMAEWAAKKHGVRAPYLLVDTTIQYDKSLCSGFKWMTGQLDGSKVVGEDTFKNGDTSIASQITRIKSLSAMPDAIMICSYLPGQSSVMRQIRAAGITVPLLGGTGLDGDYWLSSTPNLAGYYGLAKGSVRGDDPNAEVNAFVKRYAAKYGAPPLSQNVFDGYQAIQIWAKGVQKAGTLDSDKVVAAMETFKDAPTLLGPRSFSSEYHIQTRPPFLVTEVKDGKSTVIDHWTLSKDLPKDVLLGR